MTDVLTAVAVVGAVVYVIGRQLMGEPLRGKRLLLLPLVATVLGVIDVTKQGNHPHFSDFVLLSLSVFVAVAIGAMQGKSMRLEAHNGYLWGQLPTRSLWLWVGLIITHVAIVAAAHNMNAHVAAGTATILLALGANRLAQAAIVTLRALAAGIPFAPEKDGTSPLSGLFNPASDNGTQQPWGTADSLPAGRRGQIPTPIGSRHSRLLTRAESTFGVDHLEPLKSVASYDSIQHNTHRSSLKRDASEVVPQEFNSSQLEATDWQRRAIEIPSRQDWRALLQLVASRTDRDRPLRQFRGRPGRRR